MAFYGIYSAGVALTASNASDTVLFADRSSRSLTANTVLALDGDDIINIGTQGQLTTGLARAVARSGKGYVAAYLYGSAGVLLTTQTRNMSGTIASGTVVTAAAIAVVTSQQAIRTLNSSLLYGNAGNDTIALGDELNALTSSTIGGGAGNDLIGTLTQVSAGAAPVTATQTAGTWASSLIEGGGGDDTIAISAAAVLLNLSSVSLQGGQGNDVINFTTNGEIVGNTLIAGGGGDDYISARVSTALSSTIAGGGGNDTILFTAEGVTASKLVILGDSQNSATQFDGNDQIIIATKVNDLFSSNTIQAGGGNDIVRITADVVNRTASKENLYQLQAGNDIFSADSNLTADTIQAGAGADSIYFNSAARGVTLNAGGDADFVLFRGSLSGAVSQYTLTTVIGGDGADLFSATDATMTGENPGMRFGYLNSTESTISAFDTIAIGGNDGTGTTYDFFYSPGSLTLSNFNTASTAGTAIASATNGVVTFGGDAPSDLTARYQILNQNLTTVGSMAIFNGNSNNNRSYLFIQGGTTDLVVQISTAATVSGAVLRLNGDRNAFSADFA